VSGATTKQTTQFTAFLASLNAQRAAQNPPLPPFTGFSDYCASIMLSAFNGWVAQQNASDAAKVGSQATTHGDETAPTAQCTAASLGAGCTKAQVACFVLSGNTTCS
jgi:hypothetical protein